MKSFRTLILWGLCLLEGIVHAQSPSSVLAKGNWYKLGITETGMYQLDAAWFRKAGIDLTTIDPRQLQLYGNGGGMLPQSNAAPRPTDLIQNAILVEGETDGHFDATDYVLFYAESPHVIQYDSSLNRFAHQIHLYSDTAFFYLTIGDAPGLRIKTRSSLTASKTLTAFDDYVFHEQEARNLLHSGREWYGETLTFGSQTISFLVTGILANSPIKVTSAVMGGAQATTTFAVQLNNQPIGSQSVPAVSSDRYDYKGTNAVTTFITALTASPSDGKLNVTVTYDRKDQLSPQAFLNYLGVQTQRELRWLGQPFIFQSLESKTYSTTQFQLAAAPNNLEIWDITNPLRPASQLVTATNGTAQFGANTADTLRRYLAFTRTDLRQPLSISPLKNQNLRGMAPPQLLIITAPLYKDQAERLAAFRRQHDGLSVGIATTVDVYNEFSSGKTDVTALRDFVRFLYKQPSSPLKYLLLFGDATFDYKNQLAGNVAQGYVPVYESRESLSPIYTYSSDDYFGFLQDSEGEWEESYAGDYPLDLGIGRLPAKTTAEATLAVDKLVHYEDPSALGAWRQKVTFVADDGDYNLHQQDADELAQNLSVVHPNLLSEKIYLDAYSQVATPAGQKAPAVNQAIAQTIQQGALIVNYTGHGGESGWAEEQILTREDILAWRNTDRLPLMVTATCEFGRYDDPGVVSGAELALLYGRAGVIGLLTTTRPVFANTNFLINQAFYQNAFERPDGTLPRLGDTMRETKNSSLSGRNNRNFALLGDPSMQLAYPSPSIALTQVPDTLKALRRVTLMGEVRQRNGQRDASFNGTVTVNVFDKPTSLLTKGDEDTPVSYAVQNSVLFNGLATVKGGQFSCTFIVPKEVDYRLGNGKVLFYAQRNPLPSNGNQADLSGSAVVMVGGSQPDAWADLQPPQIRLFLNDTTFKTGDVVLPNARLLALLSDETGINTTGTGPGHDLTATLDDTLSFVLNTTYLANADEYRKGSVTMALPTLAEGQHVLRLKAWDLANNSGEATINFSVGSNTKNRLRNVINRPNPFREQTVFQFEHDFQGDDLQLILEIRTASGQLIRQMTTEIAHADSPLAPLKWDARTDSGETVPNGLYFYRIFARSLTTNRQLTGTGKLILTQ